MRGIVFGVDGLAFRVLAPMLQAGYLPHFQATAREGFRAVLESKSPPLTPPAWMSLVTGLKPAQHGVYDFWEYDDRAGNAGSRLVTRRKAGKAIWNLLSDYGKRVIVINVPLTYPPEPVNGLLVSGIQGASEYGNFTYPATLRAELLQRVPQYRIDVDVSAVVHGRLTPAQAAVQLIEQRIALMRYLLTEKAWDFAFVTFCAADYLQHLCWERVLSLEPHLLRYYQLLDEALGFVRAAVGHDGFVFVVSDHGFQGAHTKFAINEYLARHKWFISTQGGARLAAVALHAVGKHLLARVGMLERGRALKLCLSHQQGQSLTKVRPYLTQQEQRAAGVSVASESCASGGYADLCIARPLSAQQMADLRAELLALTDARTGQPLVAALYDTEIFGHGPFAPQTEHLLLLPTEGYTFTPTLGVPWLWHREPHLYGTHHKDGVLYACGPNICASVQPAQSPPLDLVDIVPTLLHLMQLPVPPQLDGRIIREMFLSQRPEQVQHQAQQILVAQKLNMLRER